MKLIVFSFLALSWSVASAQMPRFSGAQFLNVNGDVKSVKYDKEWPFEQKSYDFFEDGALKESFMTYDINGTALGWDISYLSWQDCLTIKYDNIGRPSEVLQISNIPGHSNELISITYTIPDEFTIEVSDKDSKKTNLNLQAKIVKRDIHDNWTEIDANLFSPQKTVAKTITRDIQYYE